MMSTASLTRTLHCKLFCNVVLRTERSFHSNFLETYKKGIESGLLRANSAQSQFVVSLERVRKELQAVLDNGELDRRRIMSVEPRKKSAGSAGRLESSPVYIKNKKRNRWGGWHPGGDDESFKRKMTAEWDVVPVISPVYVWGGVGQGKTRIVSMWNESIPLQGATLDELFHYATKIIQGKENRCNEISDRNTFKVNAHFHEFMLKFQYVLHALRGAREKGFVKRVGAPLWLENHLVWLAAWLLRTVGCTVLNIDEFQVTHISDALVLKQFFEALLHFGVVVVTTSNRPPDDLYLNGLNRERFLPFIEFVNRSWTILQLDSELDFRTVSSTEDTEVKEETSNSTTYFETLPWTFPSVQKSCLEKFVRKCCGDETTPTTMAKLKILGGREVKIPFALEDKVAVMPFDDVFGSPAGTADYLGLLDSYDQVVIHSVPSFRLTMEGDAVRRFIDFVDVAYGRGDKRNVTFLALVPLLRLFPRTPSIKALIWIVDETSPTYNLVRLHQSIKNEILPRLASPELEIDEMVIEHISILNLLLSKQEGDSTDLLFRFVLYVLYEGMPADDINAKFGPQAWHQIESGVDIDGRCLRPLIFEVTALLHPITSLQSTESEFSYYRCISRLLEMQRDARALL